MALRPASESIRVDDSVQSGTTCFHCGLPVPSGTPYVVDIGGRTAPVCCVGCHAVASAILGLGFGDYYRLRGASRDYASRIAQSEDLSAYDDPVVQQGFVRTVDGASEAELLLEGIHCSACVWLNEQVIGHVPGVQSVHVNFVTQRVLVRWDPKTVRLSTILQAVRTVGYSAYPFDPQRVDLVRLADRRKALARIFVSGLGMMQVLMYAVPSYFARPGELSPDIEELFRWAGFALTLPVIFYSAMPFLRGALRDLLHRRLGMDVPVALGIAVAFCASAVATIRGTGEVYFDSISMFVCFLLIGRYFEQVGRGRATRALQRLGRLVPEFAELLSDYPGSLEARRVAVSGLKPGQCVLVGSGQKIPADGIVEFGEGAVDEALLSGESRPVRKKPGDALTGGGMNLTDPLVMRIVHVGADTVFSGIVRLVERAASAKHPLTQLADRSAGIFILSVLVLSSLAAGYWAIADASKVIWVVVSVLVATCPCAFSLATPVALTAATGELARRGFLVTGDRAIETLARASDIVMDKTGTLTFGSLKVLGITPLGSLTRERCLQIAAALETGASHPIAAAIKAEWRAASVQGVVPDQLETFIGEGISGVVEGRRYRFGSRRFVGEGGEAPVTAVSASGAQCVWLRDEAGDLAAFWFGDELRADARPAVAALRQLGLALHLVTGDAEEPASAIAAELGIGHILAGVRPQGKVDYVRGLQRGGSIVLMVGDGVNDAPVLAKADASVAMGDGSYLAQAHSDAVIVSGRLDDLVQAVRCARKALRIIRQNVVWAFAYNLVVLPLAFVGAVAPWAAAIGMSASSLLVVLNALRLISRENAGGAAGQHASALAAA